MSAVIYAEDVFRKIESKPAPCPPYGQGADGYGKKIAMPYMVRLDGKGPWRRVYCCCFSNAGTVYVIVKGQHYCFHHDENVRLNGEWIK
jgi:hypothetical protein